MTAPRCRIHERAACAAVVIVFSFASLGAHAEDEPQRAAAAEALFDTARQLLDQNRYDEACSNLEESQRLDPAVGTLLYLGYCYEKAGKAASGWSAYKAAESAAARAKQHNRERIARERAEAIEPRLARLTVRLPTSVSDPITVRRDGVVLGQASFGQAVPVDAGTHVVEASSPGQTTWVKSVDVAQGSSVVIDIDAFTSSPQKRKFGGASGPTNEHPTVEPSSNVHAAKTGGRAGATQRWIGIAIGSVGLVGLGVGAGFAWHAASKSSDAERYRRAGTNVYDEPGYSWNGQALDSSRIALVSSVAGAAALTGGAVLYFTARSPNSKQRERATSSLSVTKLGITSTGVSLSGYWR